MSIPVNAIRKHLEEERLHPSQLFSQLTQAQYDQLKASAQDPLSVEQGKLYVRDYKDDDAKKEVLPANRVVPTLRQLHQSKRTLDKRQFQAYALSQYAIGKGHVAELFGHSEVHQRGRIPRQAQNRTIVDKANPRIKELPDGSKEITKPNGSGVLLAIDHLDVSSVNKATRGWVLTCIDVFSRKVWLFTSTNKNEAQTYQSLLKLRDSIRRDAGANWRFRQIVGDNAFELRNAATRAGARYFASKTYTGAHIVEQHNGRLRRALGRLERSNAPGTWQTWVNRMMNEYNQAAHSILKIAPERIFRNTIERANGQGFRDQEMALVVAKRNKDVAIKYMGSQSLSEYEKGSYVRISILAISSERRREEKANIRARKPYSGPNWTKAVFRIESRSKGTVTSRPVYKLGGVRGQFHRNELQQVDLSKLRRDEVGQGTRLTGANDPAVQLKVIKYYNKRKYLQHKQSR